MPKKRKHKLIQCRHFAWRLYRRQNVWQADGRSNRIDVGRHSLGTNDEQEALDRLSQLDLVQAAKHGLAEMPPKGIYQAERLSLNAGRLLYEEHITRPEITGGTRASTRRRYRPVLDKFLAFCQERQITSWERVDAKVLQRYAANLEEGEYAWRTIYLEVNTIKQIVKWLINEGQLTGCQPIVLPLEKARGTNTYCWQAAEVAAMIARCRKEPGLNWLGDVLTALACTGLRMGELATLQWSDLDLTGQTLRLTDQTSNCKLSFPVRRRTKTGRSRSFPINPELTAVLNRIPKNSGYVFEGPEGGPLQHQKVLRAFVRDVVTPLAPEFPTKENEIGFEHGRLHSFRHFFCSTCANNNVPEQMVMRWLGHRSSEMVRHYYHLHDDEAKRQMNQLNFLGNVGERSVDKIPQNRGDGGLINLGNTRTAIGSDLAH